MALPIPWFKISDLQSCERILFPLFVAFFFFLFLWQLQETSTGIIKQKCENYYFRTNECIGGYVCHWSIGSQRVGHNLSGLAQQRESCLKQELGDVFKYISRVLGLSLFLKVFTWREIFS